MGKTDDALAEQMRDFLAQLRDKPDESARLRLLEASVETILKSFEAVFDATMVRNKAMDLLLEKHPDVKEQVADWLAEAKRLEAEAKRMVSH